jgi:hypothetical protein
MKPDPPKASSIQTRLKALADPFNGHPAAVRQEHPFCHGMLTELRLKLSCSRNT